MTTQTASEEIILAEVPKNATEIIRLRHTTFNGIDLLDARVWTLPQVPGGESRPTKKGLTLRPETWAELVDALRNALASEEIGGDVSPSPNGANGE